MGRPELHRLLGSTAVEEAENEPRGKAVAPTDPVEDLEVLPVGGFVVTALAVEDSAPVIDGGASYLSQGGRHGLEVRKLLYNPVYHSLEAIDLNVGDVVGYPFDLEPEGRGKVFFVSDHHIYVPGELPVYLSGSLPAALPLPEGGAIVEIVAYEGAVLLGSLHRSFEDLRRRLREGGVDAAGMKPARPFLAEELLPLYVFGPEATRRGPGAVAGAFGRPDAVPPLGKVEADPDLLAYAVVVKPFGVAHIDAALENQVLQEIPDLVVHQAGDHGGP